MIHAIEHPDDPSRWLPVDEALATLWRDRLAALALIEGHDVKLAAQDNAISALAARVGEQDQIIGALSEHLTAELGTLRLRLAHTEDRLAEVVNVNAEQAVWITELEDRIDALEPDPLPTGPQYGVDISGHQNAAVTQAAVDDPVNEFVIVKATEGMGGKNDAYASQRAAAGGKFLGAYHFAWTGQDPLKEAANFLATAALKPGELAFLDAEKYNDTDPIDWAKSVTFCLAWLDEVKAKTGATPAVYVNWNWIKGLRTAATVAQWDRLVDYPLWLAQWADPPTPGVHDTVSPKAGSSKGWPVVVHQYGVVDGLDRNFTPDIAALRALAVK